MTVYIEYVLIDNFVIDFCLLFFSVRLLGKKPKIPKIILGAFLGALVALTYPLITVTAISLAVKILSGLLITLISANFNSKKEYYVLVVLFFSLTFLTGGCIIGVFSVFNIDYSSEILVALMFIPALSVIYLAVGVIKYLFRRSDTAIFYLDVSITVAGVSVDCVGFLDSGNGVYVDGAPVIFCSKKLLKKFFSGTTMPKMKRVYVNTFNQSSVNVALKIDQIKVYNNKKANIFNNAYLCGIDNLGTGYDVLLNPSIVKENYDERFNFSDKKIS